MMRILRRHLIASHHDAHSHTLSFSSRLVPFRFVRSRFVRTGLGGNPPFVLGDVHLSLVVVRSGVRKLFRALSSSSFSHRIVSFRSHRSFRSRVSSRRSFTLHNALGEQASPYVDWIDVYFWQCVLRG
jgi:hypothetical protein